MKTINVVLIFFDVVPNVQTQFLKWSVTPYFKVLWSEFPTLQNVIFGNVDLLNQYSIVCFCRSFLGTNIHRRI